MSGEITKEPPPSRVIAAWKDASVRSDGERNSSPSGPRSMFRLPASTSALLRPTSAGPAKALRVRDVAVYSAYVVDLNTPLSTVLMEMAERRIGSALITRNGELCGIFTSTDACREFGKHLGREEGTLDDDPEVA